MKYFFKNKLVFVDSNCFINTARCMYCLHIKLWKILVTMIN